MPCLGSKHDLIATLTYPYSTEIRRDCAPYLKREDSKMCRVTIREIVILSWEMTWAIK
jgi:hypothetical protein